MVGRRGLSRRDNHETPIRATPACAYGFAPDLDEGPTVS